MVRRLLLLTALVFTQACATVQPWQKQYLGQTSMQFNAYPMEADFTRHYYTSRETARGGTSFGGTGCGCN